MIPAEQVRQLRETTGAGMMDAKKALEEVGGDMAKAIDFLRKKGQKVHAAKSSRTTKDGVIETYLHPNRRVGVLVDIRCETDFVARSEDFLAFVHSVALQVAATNPQYVSPDQIPADTLAHEREIAADQAKGKPEAVVEKMVTGKLEKFASEVCLLKQPSVMDDTQTIEDMLHAIVAKVGEKVEIARFTRYSLDEA